MVLHGKTISSLWDKAADPVRDGSDLSLTTSEKYEVKYLILEKQLVFLSTGHSYMVPGAHYIALPLFRKFMVLHLRMCGSVK